MYSIKRLSKSSLKSGQQFFQLLSKQKFSSSNFTASSTTTSSTTTTSTTKQKPIKPVLKSHTTSIFNSTLRVGHGEKITSVNQKFPVNVESHKGEVVGQVDLDVRVFKAPLRKDLLHKAVVQYLASLRSGTATAKTRAQVRGGGRKPWKQKGTGRARAGSIRSPLWRGGGKAHGPKQRDFSIKLTKKIEMFALRSALSVKLAQNKLFIWENMELETHKTKHMKELLVNREWYGDSVLFVDAGRVDRATHTLAKATGNLPLISTLATRALGVYQILKHDKLVLSKDAALKLNERLSRTQLVQQK